MHDEILALVQHIKKRRARMQRVLVIDDDSDVTSLLKRGLSYEGFAIDTAKSGTEGLGIERERPSDLVILDVMMPGLCGFEVLQRLRAIDEQLPVLLLTAKDASADQLQGCKTGADDYVNKPFMFEVLLARVHALLRWR
jgi:DNA-binding response OmpR family regulator